MRCEHYQAKGVVRTSVDLRKTNLPQFHHNLSLIVKKVMKGSFLSSMNNIYKAIKQVLGGVDMWLAEYRQNRLCPTLLKHYSLLMWLVVERLDVCRVSSGGGNEWSDLGCCWCWLSIITCSRCSSGCWGRARVASLQPDILKWEEALT